MSYGSYGYITGILLTTWYVFHALGVQSYRTSGGVTGCLGIVDGQIIIFHPPGFSWK